MLLCSFRSRYGRNCSHYYYYGRTKDGCDLEFVAVVGVGVDGG